MMKRFKSLICGILIGVTVTLSATALAELIANPNPYPVKVNGQEVQIEGYNINDSTYFKIRDVAAAIGGIDVDFVDGAVTIKTAEITPTATSAPTPLSQIPPEATEVNPAISALYKHYKALDGLTSDGISYESIDGVKYIPQVDIEIVYSLRERGYEFGVKTLYDKDNNVVFDNIVRNPNSSSYVEYTYYETVLRPWLQEHCK